MVPINRYVFALDGLYKFNTKHSLRLELQYLYSPFVTMETTGAEGPVQERLNDKRNNGDWWAAQLEYSFAPVFSVFVSDMYNFQLERVHYYNVGSELYQVADEDSALLRTQPRRLRMLRRRMPPDACLYRFQPLTDDFVLMY